VTITNTHAFVSCQGHTIKRWKEFTQEQIYAMGGLKAIKFYPILLRLIEDVGK